MPHSKNAKQPSSVHRYHFPTLSQQSSLPDEQHYASPQQVATKYQALMEEGREAGFAEGLRLGLEQGQQQGQQLGQERGFKAGMQEGRDAGAKQAYAESKPKLDEALHQSEQLYQALESALQETLVGQRDILCRLVSQVCRQVLRAELTLKPTQILPLIEESLALLPKQQGAVAIRLDPATHGMLKELAPEQTARWELQADPQLSPGSFHIHTGLAEAESLLDERIDQSVEQLRRQLTASEQDADEASPVAAISEVTSSEATRSEAASAVTATVLPWRQEDVLPDLALSMDRLSDDDFKA